MRQLSYNPVFSFCAQFYYSIVHKRKRAASKRLQCPHICVDIAQNGFSFFLPLPLTLVTCCYGHSHSEKSLSADATVSALLYPMRTFLSRFMLYHLSNGMLSAFSTKWLWIICCGILLYYIFVDRRERYLSISGRLSKKLWYLAICQLEGLKGEISWLSMLLNLQKYKYTDFNSWISKSVWKKVKTPWKNLDLI